MCSYNSSVENGSGEKTASALDTRVGTVGKANLLPFANSCCRINASSMVCANLVPTGTWVSPLEYRAKP